MVVFFVGVLSFSDCRKGFSRCEDVKRSVVSLKGISGWGVVVFF